MPQLGETVTEGTITRWMKAVGEQVSRDEPLFEVSTDKVDSEVPAPATGVLAEILVPEGETVVVGARLAVISDGATGGAAAGAPAGATKEAAGAPDGAPAPAIGEPPADEAGEGAVPAGRAAAPPASPAQAPPAPAVAEPSTAQAPPGTAATARAPTQAASRPPAAPPPAPSSTVPPATPEPPEAPPNAATAPAPAPSSTVPPATPEPPEAPPNAATAPPPSAPPPSAPPPSAPGAVPPAPSGPPPSRVGGDQGPAGVAGRSTPAAPAQAPPPSPRVVPGAAPVAPEASAPPPVPPPPPPAGYVARGTEGGAADPAARAAGVAAGGMLLSPVVRRLLDEHGISPSDVTGTGLGGRITREDVLSVIDARRARAGVPGEPAAESEVVTAPRPREAVVPPPVQPAAPGPSDAAAAPADTVSAQAKAGPQTRPGAAAPAAPAEAGPSRSAPAHPPSVALLRPAPDRVVPFSNIRRRTAEHMVRSKATSPHAYIAYETDFENVERVRHAWGERFRSEEGFSLTYLPFVVRATVESLRDFPHLNATVLDDALVVHQQVNLGIAVDLSHEGLIVPVMHRAEEITLRGVARRVRDLADRARSRQLSADDIAGGTFSITNDGPFGTYFTVPIINQPQVAILATDGIRRRPVVVELPDGTESIAIHSVGTIGLSWDHRAVDGAYVSSFLRQVAKVLSARDWSAEL
jgi:pyruvate dehydrogenase E2 component (dihydrolipoamide acetyltransferase)